jgi:hypothetical protein
MRVDDDVRLDSLDLSARSLRALQRARLQTAGDVRIKSQKGPIQLQNFGTKSLRELYEALGDPYPTISRPPPPHSPPQATISRHVLETMHTTLENAGYLVFQPNTLRSQAHQLKVISARLSGATLQKAGQDSAIDSDQVSLICRKYSRYIKRQLARAERQSHVPVP